MTNKNHVGFGIIIGGLLTAMIGICFPPHDPIVMGAMIPVVIFGAILYE